MTAEQVKALMSAEGAVYRGVRSGIAWYWAPSRQAFLGVKRTGDGYTVAVVRGKCQC